MSKSNRLEQIADQLFDLWEYDEAVRLYRQAAILEPTLSALSNSYLALMFAHLAFLNQVIDKHPNSLRAYIERIIVDLANNRGVQAFQTCNELLEKHRSNINLRGLRLNAAIKLGNSQYYVEDFIFVWNSLKNPRGKRKMLRDVLSVTDTHFIETFQELSKKTEFSEEFQNLFRSKAKELEYLKEIMDSQLTNQSI